MEANRLIIENTQRINPFRHPNWDVLVTAHPNYSFFHTAGWAKVLESTYGYAPTYFTSYEAGAIHSLLPLMEVDSWLTGRRGVGLPFTDECEPFCSGAGSFKNLFQSAVEFGKARSWKYIECRGGQGMFEGAPASVSFYGHRLDLTSDEERLFSFLESSVQRAIRKAEKTGVKVEVSRSLEAIRIFYSLQCKTRKKHGLPPQPFLFFLNIYKYILSQDMGIVVLASYQGSPVAASVYFHAGDRAIYKYGASDEAFQHLRGSNLVMWEAIKWYARNAAKTLHLGRTSTGNEGLRRFKLGWGSEEQKIEYVKYDLRENRFVTDTDESSGWHNIFFRMMPVFCSRIIGTALYKHWA